MYTGNYHITKAPQRSIYRQYHFSGYRSTAGGRQLKAKLNRTSQNMHSVFHKHWPNGTSYETMEWISNKAVHNYEEEIAHVGAKLHNNSIKLV